MEESPDNRAFVLEELWFSDALGRGSIQAIGWIENLRMKEFLFKNLV